MAPGTEPATRRQRSTGTLDRSLRQHLPQLGTRERWLWAFVTVALVADVVTTLVGLRLGLAESNPLIAGALATGGVVGFLAVKASVLGIGVGLRAARPSYRLVVPLGLALPWAVAASSNVILLVGQL